MMSRYEQNLSEFTVDIGQNVDQAIPTRGPFNGCDHITQFISSGGVRLVGEEV